jgi:hypothetical protein
VVVMTNRARAAALVLALALLMPLGVGSASAAPVCEPYCNDTTTRIANRIDGRGHGAWLATVLDQYGYHGRRWAEIARIPAGQGKRSVGVIHVPAGKGPKVHRALKGWWFAQRRNKFVLPLVTSTDTRGGSRVKFRTAARYAARKLGKGWRVVAP